MLLPDIISKEPLGVMVRKGDDKWFDIVRWTFIALITAEEKGITPGERRQLKTPRTRTSAACSACEGDMGKALGLDNKWAYNVDQAGRQFRRDVGPQHHADGRAARDQQHLDQGRPAIRAADPVKTMDRLPGPTRRSPFPMWEMRAQARGPWPVRPQVLFSAYGSKG